jgi:hypothetical protein
MKLMAIQALKTIGGLLVAIAIMLGVSYCSEWPKYQFERTAREVGRGLPGARLISSAKSGDLSSPVSWFWPATTTWTFAVPDPVLADRFFTATLTYGEEQALSFLVDADCKDRTLIWYDLDEPDSAFPARDLFGEPVVAPNGKTYRRSDYPYHVPPGWLHAFCDTDWTAERKAEKNQ